MKYTQKVGKSEFLVIDRVNFTTDRQWNICRFVLTRFSILIVNFKMTIEQLSKMGSLYFWNRMLLSFYSTV